MADIVAAAVRSRMMAGIRGKNTKPELQIRTGLHRLGFRYRLHESALPGCPDIVFPRYRAAIFVHGCFWHGHDCHLFKWPRSRPEFWRKKIERNREIDKSVVPALQNQAWRTAVIWECALKGKTRKSLDEVLQQCEDWLRSQEAELHIRGDNETGSTL